MSRRSNRRPNTVDKQEIQRMIDSAIARRFTPPAGANVTPISQSVIDQMYQSMAPQDKTQSYFSPGAPIRPVPGITPKQGPRQFQYTVGYNIGQLPRSTEMTSFQTLRNLAALCDAIAICERVWFDLCSKPELQIKPKPRFLIDDNGDPIPQEKLMSEYGSRIAKWEDFFAKPDRKRSLKQWMRMALKDVLELDALAIFKQKDRAGRLLALQIIDGSTIKPLLDERGLAPSPPFPAYQQFVYGVPGMLILDTDLIYRREVERSDSPYGFSRTEAVIVRVNQMLRKENKDLAYFTDGNVPPGLLMPPDDGTTDWTPEQLLMYQAMWDGMLAGNDAVRSRLKVAPPGSVYTKLDLDSILVEFDDFLYTVIFGTFGVPKTEASFTEKSNRSTGETQEAMVYRRTMSPIMDMFGETFTDVMADEGETDLYATWKAFEEPEDFKTKVEAWNILTTNGTQSTSQAATALGLKPMIETEPFVIVPGQGITFISDANDMRDEAKAAKLAGYQQQKDGMNEQEPQQGAKGAQPGGGGTKGAASGATGKPQANDSGNGTGSTRRNLEPVVPGQSSDAERAERTIDAQTTQGHDETDSSQRTQDTETGLAYTSGQNNLQGIQRTQAGETQHGVQSGFLQDQRASAEGARPSTSFPRPMESAERAISAELRRWRDCAIKDVKAGKPPREFVSDIISAREQSVIREGLEVCLTPEEIRGLFDQVRALERAKPQDAEIIGAEPELVYDAEHDIYEAADIDEQLDALRAQGDEIEWEAHVSASGVCPTCKPNDGVRRKIGERFPSGHRLPQVHGHCQCAVRVVKA